MQLTNATKAIAISTVNALLGVLVVFGVPLTSAQIAALLALGNALAALAVAFTYKQSPKRIPE